MTVRIPAGWLEETQITCCAECGDWLLINDGEQLEPVRVRRRPTVEAEERRGPARFWFCPWLAADLILTGCQSEARLFVFFLIEGSFCKIVETFKKSLLDKVTCVWAERPWTPRHRAEPLHTPFICSSFHWANFYVKTFSCFIPPEETFLFLCYFIGGFYFPLIFSAARRKTPRGCWGVNTAFVERERRADGKRWPPFDLLKCTLHQISIYQNTERREVTTSTCSG